MTDEKQIASETDSDNEIGTGKLVRKLLLITVGMFAFGFALVPLYDVFCEITGLNGKTGGRYDYEPASAQVDTSRTVTVQFRTINNGNMSWEFWPEVSSMEVHPGQMAEVMFYARNPGDKDMIGQAVPSVAPFRAADLMRKTECFCFTHQPLQAGGYAEMPLRFFIDQDLPADVTRLTLSYTLFDVTEGIRLRTSAL